MELIKAIVSKNKEQIDNLLQDPNTDVNFSSGYTPLWCAITGMASRPQVQMGQGDLDLVNKLIKRGADPNKKCVYIPPIYATVFDDRWDIMLLLLLARANPNAYAVLSCVKDDEISIAKCRLPLSLAIENANLDCVKLLVKHGALFNKRMINKAKTEKEDIKEFKYRFADHNERYANLKKIILFLEEKYTDDMEDNMKKYLDQNRYTGQFINHFIGVENLVIDDYIKKADQ